MSQPTMRIGEVATRTGLTTVTIRAWQRRYGLLTPRRTEGGQRLYDEADVAALRQVRERVNDGWAVAAAAASVTGADPAPDAGADEGAAAPRSVAWSDDGLAALRTAVAAEAHPPQPALALAPGSHDVAALRATLCASQAVLRAADPAAVVAALVDLVVELGGEVAPASTSGDHVVPVDLGLGEIDSVVACAEPFSIARMRLEAVLPRMVEDGRRMITLLRAAAR